MARVNWSSIELACVPGKFLKVARSEKRHRLRDSACATPGTSTVARTDDAPTNRHLYFNLNLHLHLYPQLQRPRTNDTQPLLTMANYLASIFGTEQDKVNC